MQEKPRPTYTALSPGVQVNPVTGQLEPYYPESIRTWRMVFGIGVIVMLVSCAMLTPFYWPFYSSLNLSSHHALLHMLHIAYIAPQIMMVIIFIVAVIMYRTIITLVLFQWTEFNESFVSQKLGLDPQLIGSMTSSCINLIFIVVMGYVSLCCVVMHCS